MKKRLYSTLLLLVCCTLTFAQAKVQGVPRSDVKQPLMKARSATGIDFASIKYWVGTGSNRAALIVNWHDGKDNDANLVWGYKWEDGTAPSGETMLRAIAADDARFYMLLNSNTPYGTSIGGFGYDLNGNGNIKLLENGKEHELTDGVCDSDASFDDFTSNDAEDHWQSGWMKGYWSYWTADSENGTLGYASTGASGRTLTDGCIDGWSFMPISATTTDFSGDIVYVEKGAGEAGPYAKGTFFLNEDWYGHQNSTINFLSDDGEWTYRVVQKENPGHTLGCTAPFGQIYGDRFYVMSKQEKDPGDTTVGGRLTVLDAKTMKIIKQFQTIATDASGQSIADGRGFLGVDEHKGYVGTSNGIYILDLDNLELKGAVEGTGNDGGSPYEQLYNGQLGNMVRVNDRVFAVHQTKGLLVIDAATDKVVGNVAAPEGWGFGSVVLSKDGNLWLSVADPSGSGAADRRIVRLDPNTLEQTVINCPDSIYGPANSWYAWTPDAFCASKQQNALYWNGGESSWRSSYTIYKYDIDSNEFSTYLDFNDAEDGFYLYGCSFRIDPVTDEAYISLYKSFGDNTYVVRKYDASGSQLAEYPMIANYWFPSLPVFTDDEAPAVTAPEPVTFETMEPVTLSLKGIATDADNFDAAIVKTVKAVSNPAVVKAEMACGDLVLTPLGAGTADVTIGINSNGKTAECVLAVSVPVATAISGAGAGSTDGTDSVYDLNGRRTNGLQKGLNIIRTKSGKTLKVVVR